MQMRYYRFGNTLRFPGAADGPPRAIALARSHPVLSWGCWKSQYRDFWTQYI